jgi:Delta7-sterol 5-desaturase
MDVVLEIADTFIADYAYAFFLPARPAPYGFPEPTAANLTDQTFSSWQYQPATKMLYLEPSQAAYMSMWSRDNLFRQFISLYMLTWYVLSP